MNEFINTIDILGDEAVQDALLEGTLTEFADNRLVAIWHRPFGDSPIESVKLPLLETVNQYAFDNSKLTRIWLPAASAIADRAFQYCHDLTIIHLPMAQKIYGSAFAFAGSGLETLILSSFHFVATLSNKAHLSGTPIAEGTGYIYVRKKWLEEYKNATNWSTYAAQFRAIEDYPEIKAIVDADLAEMRGETT